MSEFYTNFINEEIPKAIVDFLNADELDYDIVNRAVTEYKEDYLRFPPSNSIQSLDMKYEEDHKRFYKKYRPFVDKCKEYIDFSGITGYGGISDAVKIKIVEMCRDVDYTFPYGWKDR